ncbi:MAG: sulfatase-like hydrolase/transferase [Bacteroidota bacterium]
MNYYYWKIGFLSLFMGVNLLFAQQERPNIIVILTDDQRWDAMGAMGNPIIQTPNMDQLASQSTLFQNAFVTTPICAASRASIMTGMYERTHTFTFGTPPLQRKFIDRTYPKLLKDAGYHLGFFGKFGMQFEENAQDNIFEAFDNSNTRGYFRLVGPGWKKHLHLTDLTTDKAMAYIRTLKDDAPFCVSISYNAPHADDANPRQYIWPASNTQMYQGTKLPEVPLTADEYWEARRIQRWIRLKWHLLRFRSNSHHRLPLPSGTHS